MKPKLTFSKYETYRVTPKWITNGHWGVLTSFAESNKMFKRHLQLDCGLHMRGERSDLDNESVYRVLDAMDASNPLELTDEVQWDDGEIVSVILKNSDGEKYYCNPSYLPVLTLGEPFGNGPLDPMVSKVDGEIVSLVMPRRP